MHQATTTQTFTGWKELDLWSYFSFWWTAVCTRKRNIPSAPSHERARTERGDWSARHCLFSPAPRCVPDKGGGGFSTQKPTCEVHAARATPSEAESIKYLGITN